MTKKNLFALLAILLIAACSGKDKDAQLDEAVRVGELGQVSEEYVEDGEAASRESVFEDTLLGGPQSASQEDLVVNVGDRVYFGYDRYDLTPEARSLLEAQADWLKQYTDITVTIEGHCDERGTREYNLGLGDRRANSVKNYLVALGVSPSRVSTISYGKERPVALGSNPEAWAQNRRAVMVVN